MADDADVQAPDITPDDFAAEEQVTAKADSSPAEEKKPEPAKETETPAESDDAPAREETPPEADTEGEPPVEPAEEKPLGKAEERKAQLNTEIRDLVAQRNALKSEVEKVNSEVYQPASEEDLVAEGMTATEAKVEALRQKMEVKDYNDQVIEAQLTLSSESQRVLNDFAWTNPDSDQYEKELAQEASELLEQNLIIDQNTGQIIGSHVSPYKLYQTLDRASGISATKGQLKGQQATEQMLANADSAASAAPAKKPSDPLAELWSEPL